jgi:hypothetical protein
LLVVVPVLLRLLLLLLLAVMLVLLRLLLLVQMLLGLLLALVAIELPKCLRLFDVCHRLQHACPPGDASREVCRHGTPKVQTCEYITCA